MIDYRVTAAAKWANLGDKKSMAMYTLYHISRKSTFISKPQRKVAPLAQALLQPV